MTIGQKRAAVLLYCVRAWESLDTSRRARVFLEHADVREAIHTCELKDEDDLRFYIRSLADMDLLESYVTGAAIGYRITTAGYEHAEAIEAEGEERPIGI